MKTLLNLACALAIASTGFGAAPEKIGGRIYYQTTSIAGVGPGGQANTFAAALKGDGTYVVLFVFSNYFDGRSYVSLPADGTYSYRKIDGQTGQLTFSNFPANSSGADIRTLNFNSDTSGFIPRSLRDPITTSHSFRLAAADVSPPLVNCSNRSFVRPGGTAFTGFVIAPGESRTVLIRAIGPGLTPFGITDALGNPHLAVFNAATNIPVDLNDDWFSDPIPSNLYTGRAEAMKRTSAAVGAFPLVENSKDAAVILTLYSGAYTAQVSSSDPADSGQALIEVYMLP